MISVGRKRRHCLLFNKTGISTSARLGFYHRLHWGKIYFQTPSGCWQNLFLCGYRIYGILLLQNQQGRQTDRHKHTQRGFSKISTILCSWTHNAYSLLPLPQSVDSKQVIGTTCTQVGGIT